jgi:hypothetical protein
MIREHKAKSPQHSAWPSLAEAIVRSMPGVAAMRKPATRE